MSIVAGVRTDDHYLPYRAEFNNSFPCPYGAAIIKHRDKYGQLSTLSSSANKTDSICRLLYKISQLNALKRSDSTGCFVLLHALPATSGVLQSLLSFNALGGKYCPKQTQLQHIGWRNSRYEW
jgi:hypothetical protein